MLGNVRAGHWPQNSTGRDQEGIIPIDYSKYPKDWKTKIRPAILERARHKCERCGVANYAVGARDCDGTWHDEADIHYLNSDRGWELFGEWPKIIKIILTVAHIDNPDPMDCRPENLQALCQKCHINHDAKDKGERMKKANRERRDAATGQLKMFEERQP